MKVYIGKNTPGDQYKKIEVPDMISYVAEDAECTEIVVEGILRSMTLEEIKNYLILVRQKTRIGGTVVIKDLDFDMVHYLYDKNGNIEDLNKQVFANGTVLNSFLKQELVASILLQLGYEPVVTNLVGLDFVIVVRRVG